MFGSSYNRCPAYKQKLVESFTEFAVEKFREGKFVPVLDKNSYKLEEAQAALEYLLQNKTLGKVVLLVNESRM